MPNPTYINRNALRNMLLAHFSLAEIKELIDLLNEDFEKVFSPNATKTEAVINTIKYFEARDRLVELAQKAQSQIPEIDWSSVGDPSSDEAVFDRPRIVVLRSAPLIYRDANGKARPIDVLDFATERDALNKSFDEAKRAVAIQYGIATTDAAQTALTLGCRVLHYSGHGHPDFLAFENQRGEAQPVSPEMLKAMMGENSETKLVFVSACHSERAARAFVDAGAPHVVGVRTETTVLDNAARIFARAFYLAALAGKTIRRSFDAGKTAVLTDPDLQGWGANEEERDKFVLLPEDQPHDDILCANWPRGNPLYLAPSDPPVRGMFLSRPENFTGRNADMQAVMSLILSGHMTTLRGAAGIGKTALSIETAYYMNERGLFKDGCAFVSLRGAITADTARANLAEALGVRAENAAQLKAHLQGKQILIVFDNCEDLYASDVTGFRSFLQTMLSAGDVKVLLTSRIAMGNLQGIKEQVYDVLRLPPREAAEFFLKFIPQNGIARVKNELGAVSHADLLQKLERHEAMRYLGGHPQAMALIASFLGDKTLAEVSALLKTKKEIALDDPNIPKDQRDATTSMIASLDVSIAILSQQKDGEPALRLFGVMGLLPGGALPDVLNALWGDESWGDPMDMLVRHSLVQRQPYGSGALHTALPFITDYALGKLSAEGMSLFGPRAAAFYAALGSALYQALRDNQLTFGQVGERLRIETDNMAACLRAERRAGLTSSPKQPTPVGVIGESLCALLLLVDRARDGLRIGQEALLACREIKDIPGEANVQKALGDLALRVDDLKGARAAYEAALPLYRQIEDRLGEANVLQALGDLALRVADLKGARAAYEAALPLYRQIEARLGEANVQKALGDLALRVADLKGARAAYEAALPLYRQIEDRLGEANVLQALGDLALRVADLKGARAAYEAALPLYRQIEARLGEANVQKALGDLALRVADLKGARAAYEAALPLYRQIEARLGEANVQKALGDLALRVDDLKGARAAYEAALPLYRQIEDRLGEANVQKALGDLALRVDDLKGARAAYEAALPLYRQIEARLGEANVQKALGDLALRVADLKGARAAYEAALPLYRQIEDRLGEANTLQSLGNLASAENEPTTAFGFYHQALEIHQSIGNQLGVGACFVYMARAEKLAGNFGLSAILSAQALEVFRAIGDRWGQALALSDQAESLLRLEAQAPAFAAWWQARDIFRAIGDERNAGQLEAIFGQIQEQAGAQWPALEAELSANAEAIRAAAIEELLKAQQQAATAADQG